MRLPAGLTTAAVLALLPAACGGSAEPLDLSAVRRATQAAGTARVHVSAAITVADEQPVLVRGAGAVDLARRRSHLRLHLPAELGGGTLEVLSSPAEVLLRSDLLDPGGRWVRRPTPPPAGSALAPMLRGVDPAGLLAAIGGRPAGPATPVELHGERVRRHRLPAHHGGEILLWIDEHGRLRRYDHRRPHGAGGLTLVLELRGLGEPVRLPLPGAVVDAVGGGGSGEPGG